MHVKSLDFVIAKNTLLALFVLQPLFLFWYKGHFLLALLGLCLILFFDLSARHGRLWFDRRQFVVYLFFLLPLVSVLWSRYPDETLWRGALVLVNAGIFYLMMRANAFNPHAVISKLVIIVPAIMALLFVAIYVKFGSIRPDSREMADIVGSIANAGPAMVVVCVPFLLLTPYLIRRRIYIWGALASCLLVVLLSQSRGGLLMLVIAVFMSLLLYPKKWSIRIVRIIKTGATMIVLASLVVAFVGMERTVIPVLDRFKGSQLTSIEGLTDPSRDAEDYRRALIYAQGFKVIAEEPVTGIGYGALTRHLEELHGRGIISHNLIITAWGEMGIPGLVALFWLVGAVFMGLGKYRKKGVGLTSDKFLAAATLCALIVVFIHAQFRPLFSNPMFPVLLAQAYTMIKLAKRTSSAAVIQKP